MVKQLSHCRTVSSEKRESQAWDTAKKALKATGIYRNNRNLQENRNTVMFFCRTVALFFHKWISRHSDKNASDIVPSDPALNKSAYFWENKKAVNTCNYVSTAFFAAFYYFINTHFFVAKDSTNDTMHPMKFKRPKRCKMHPFGLLFYFSFHHLIFKHGNQFIVLMFKFLLIDYLEQHFKIYISKFLVIIY